MKRLILLFACVFVLIGCDRSKDDMDRALAFRQNLLQQNGCRFDCDLTADYGDILYQFSLSCQADSNGVLSFTVTAPESISGIAGTISKTGANVKFDDTVLGFPILSEDLPTPLSAPYLFLTALRGGYIRACDMQGNIMSLTIADTYEEDSIVMNIKLDEDQKPISCEFIWHGRRILSMLITSFNHL